MEITGAALGFPVSEKALLNDLEVSEGGWECGPHIVGPVGGTIADHSSTKFDHGEGLVELSLLVVLVDLPGKVRNVDSSVRLTGNENFVVKALGELGEPHAESIDGVLGLNHIVSVEIAILTGNRPADTGGTLKEHNVGAFVPRVRVRLEVILAIVNDNRSKFLHHAEHGGAAGTTIEPNDNGISFWGVH